MAGNGAAGWRKGLGLWIGAAAVGSVLGTLVADVYAGGNLTADFARDFNRGLLLAFMEIGLIFTLGGSALLALVYGAARQRLSQAHTYTAILLAGVAAGGLVLLPLRMPVWGMIYAAATSLAWVGLHRLLFGRERTQA